MTNPLHTDRIESSSGQGEGRGETLREGHEPRWSPKILFH